MKYHKPAFFDQFHCIGSACTDTCCAGWEIEVDETTAEGYLAEKGEFGDRLRREIGTEPGEYFFKLKNNRCPFLNKENLCDIFINLGEDRLCDICREHPRFYNWFGDYTEVGLGLCCEEAERLLFSDSKPLTFIEEVTQDEEEDEWAEEMVDEVCPEDYEAEPENAFGEDLNENSDEEFNEDFEDGLDGAADEFGEFDEDAECEQMLSEREAIFSILQDRSECIGLRLKELLIQLPYAEEVLMPFTGTNWQDTESIPEWDYTVKPDTETLKKSARYLIEFFHGMESLDETWPNQMAELEDKINVLLSENNAEEFLTYMQKEDRLYEYEHIAVYLIYRYYPEILFDGQKEAKILFAVAFICLLFLLDENCFLKAGSFTQKDQIEQVRRFSKEIEYCPENMERFAKSCESQYQEMMESVFGLCNLMY